MFPLLHCHSGRNNPSQACGDTREEGVREETLRDSVMFKYSLSCELPSVKLKSQGEMMT